MRGFFHRQGKFQPVSPDDERGEQQIPGDLWVKCPKCNELIYSKELEHNRQVCPKCGHHFRLRARARIDLLADPNSFEEWDAGLRPQDPLQFADGSGAYPSKLAKTQQKSGEPEALITGRITIEDRPLAVAVADFDFLGASMGSVFGEKFTRAAERCTTDRTPLLAISASGGARMHEGIFSLMQMAKTIASLTRLSQERVPFFSLLTDPCYGGVPASYATVADVILAEPGALIGFAGPRVIEQIIKQKLPEGFQTAEFLMEHGMVDLIVERSSVRSTLTTLLDHYARAHRQEVAPRANTHVVDVTAGLIEPTMIEASDG